MYLKAALYYLVARMIWRKDLERTSILEGWWFGVNRISLIFQSIQSAKYPFFYLNHPGAKWILSPKPAATTFAFPSVWFLLYDLVPFRRSDASVTSGPVERTIPQRMRQLWTLQQRLTEMAARSATSSSRQGAAAAAGGGRSRGVRESEPSQTRKKYSSRNWPKKLLSLTTKNIEVYRRLSGRDRF